MSHIGTNKIGKIYLGETEIAKMYLGSDLVYQNVPPGPPNYFWSEAIDSGTFTLTVPSSVTTSLLTSVSYSIDGGITWTTTNNEGSGLTITTPTISAGGKVLWKGIATAYASAARNGNSSLLDCTADFNVGGDIASLFTGDTCKLDKFTVNYAFTRFFYGRTKLINAEDLIISVKTTMQHGLSFLFYACSNLETAPTIQTTTVGNNGMYQMFYQCSKLVVAPDINITTPATSCCHEMFYKCTSMTTPPSELKVVTSTAQSIYRGMFSDCTALTSAPIIRATSLGSNCFYRMFYGCTSLTTAPDLNMLTVPANGYYQMFYNCSSLNHIKMMATDISKSNCLYQWVSGVAATGTFVKNSSATWTTTGVSGVPTGWTVTTASS